MIIMINVLNHIVIYVYRHSDDFGMDNNQEIVNTMTLLERAELLGIIHEGYSSSRLLDILEAVFQEWQKAAVREKLLSLRYW